MHVSVLHDLYVLQTFLNLTNWSFNQPFTVIVHKFYSEKACLSEDLLFCLEHVGDLKFGCIMMVIKKMSDIFLFILDYVPRKKLDFYSFLLEFSLSRSEINKILVAKWINHHYVQSWFSFVLVCQKLERVHFTFKKKKVVIVRNEDVNHLFNIFGCVFRD